MPRAAPASACPRYVLYAPRFAFYPCTHPSTLQETIRRNFAGRARVTVLRAKELPKESSTADYVVGGSTPDTYVLCEIKCKHGYDQGRTPTVMDSYAPEWKDTAAATFDLLVEDLATAELELLVKDENRLGKDTSVGKAVLPLSQVTEKTWTGWLPIQADKGDRQVGSIEIAVLLLPADQEELSQSETAAVKADAEDKSDDEDHEVRVGWGGLNGWVGGWMNGRKVY